jgi:hypothetical protein
MTALGLLVVAGVLHAGPVAHHTEYSPVRAAVRSQPPVMASMRREAPILSNVRPEPSSMHAPARVTPRVERVATAHRNAVFVATRSARSPGPRR